MSFEVGIEGLGLRVGRRKAIAREEEKSYAKATRRVFRMFRIEIVGSKKRGRKTSEYQQHVTRGSPYWVCDGKQHIYRAIGFV